MNNYPKLLLIFVMSTFSVYVMGHGHHSNPLPISSDAETQLGRCYNAADVVLEVVFDSVGKGLERRVKQQPIVKNSNSTAAAMLLNLRFKVVRRIKGDYNKEVFSPYNMPARQLQTGSKFSQKKRKSFSAFEKEFYKLERWLVSVDKIKEDTSRRVYAENAELVEELERMWPDGENNQSTLDLANKKLNELVQMDILAQQEALTLHQSNYEKKREALTLDFLFQMSKQLNDVFVIKTHSKARNNRISVYVPTQIGKSYYLFLYDEPESLEESLRLSNFGLFDIYPVSLYKDVMEKELKSLTIQKN